MVYSTLRSFFDILTILPSPTQVSQLQNKDRLLSYFFFSLAQKPTEMVFRVLVSLTHLDAKWCTLVMRCTPALGFITREIYSADDTRWKLLNQSSKPASYKVKVKKEEEDAVKVEDEEGETYDYLHSRSMDATKSKSPEDALSQSLDRLCLSLALLTNLVQVLPEVKDSLRTLMINPSCSKPACVSRCACPSGKQKSAVIVLINVYNHQLPFASGFTSSDSPSGSKSSSIKRESPDPHLSKTTKIETNATRAPTDIHTSADSSFLLGHLCLLFGMLMMSNSPNQDLILSSVTDTTAKDSDSKASALARMIDKARAISAFYTLLHRRHGGDAESGHEGQAEGADGATSALASRGRQNQDAQTGEEVTREVIMFLEGLRRSLL
jgi:hypothetical protein